MPKAIDYKDKGPMLYWNLPAGSSAAQLAKKEKCIDSNDYILTKKRDGALYRALISDGKVILQSRTISKKTGDYVEKQENVPHICEALSTIFPSETILMGEICYPEYMGTTISSDIVKIMGALPAKAIKRQKEQLLVFYIFDVLLYDGEDYSGKAYEKRIEKIKEISAAVETDCLEFVEPVYDNKREQIAMWLEEGWEGGMLMHKDKPYVFDVKGKNKRPSWTSIKIKQEVLNDIDLIIVDSTEPVRVYTGKHPETHLYWEDGNGNKIKGLEHGKGYTPITYNYFHNLIGGLVLAAYSKNEDLIEVCRVANLTDQIRDDITANFENYLLKVVTVGAMSIDLERKSLRHPKLLKIRKDKSAAECRLSDIFE